MPHPVPAAPMLFTSQERAKAKWHYMESSDADAYLQAVEDYGEDLLNRAYENTPPLRVFFHRRVVTDRASRGFGHPLRHGRR